MSPVSPLHHPPYSEEWTWYYDPDAGGMKLPFPKYSGKFMYEVEVSCLLFCVEKTKRATFREAFKKYYGGLQELVEKGGYYYEDFHVPFSKKHLDEGVPIFGHDCRDQPWTRWSTNQKFLTDKSLEPDSKTEKSGNLQQIDKEVDSEEFRHSKKQSRIVIREIKINNKLKQKNNNKMKPKTKRRRYSSSSSQLSQNLCESRSLSESDGTESYVDSDTPDDSLSGIIGISKPRYTLNIGSTSSDY
ncbi:hypothetical protein B0H19DRAFT_1077617 [Mycena capillaripes]|nr:hypothetical protein B0H19DRAFT_1077617 [Mycena capillaripes]